MSVLAGGILTALATAGLIGGAGAMNQHRVNDSARRSLSDVSSAFSPENVLQIQELLERPAHSYLDMLRTDQINDLVNANYGQDVRGLNKKQVKDIQNTLNLLALREQAQFQPGVLGYENRVDASDGNIRLSDLLAGLPKEAPHEGGMRALAALSQAQQATGNMFPSADNLYSFNALEVPSLEILTKGMK